MNYIKREGALQVDLDGTIPAGEGDFDVSDFWSFTIFRPLSHITVPILKHRDLGWEDAGRFASRCEAT